MAYRKRKPLGVGNLEFLEKQDKGKISKMKNTIAFATYNLLHSKVEEMCLDILQTCRSDVIFFQNVHVDWQKVIRQRMGHIYPHTLVKRATSSNTLWIEMSVVSKWPIVEVEWIECSSSSGWIVDVFFAEWTFRCVAVNTLAKWCWMHWWSGENVLDVFASQCLGEKEKEKNVAHIMLGVCQSSYVQPKSMQPVRIESEPWSWLDCWNRIVESRILFAPGPLRVVKCGRKDACSVYSPLYVVFELLM